MSSATFDFRDQVVVVTGVGRVGQIGYAVADGFAQAGARLVIAAHDGIALGSRAREFAARGVEVRTAAGDLTQPDVANLVVEQAVKGFGRLDVLVNVAGGFTGGAPVTEASLDVLDKAIAINVTTMYLVSRAAAQVMIGQHKGAIVSFASVAALSARPAMAAYSAAKAGVAALTRSMALELRDSGVRVNAVAPGLVRTGDNVGAIGDGPARWVEIADIVNAVLFLSSDLSAGITGHVLPVSRGDI